MNGRKSHIASRHSVIPLILQTGKEREDVRRIQIGEVKRRK